MSVELLVQHPGGEWMEVEVGPMESLAGLKERVASQSGMCVNTFDLSFEGEVFGDSDGRLVGELPFGDRSELQLVLSKKEVALHRLKELGWAGKGVMSLANYTSGKGWADEDETSRSYETEISSETLQNDEQLSVEGRQDLDSKLCEVLATMMEAGMCNDDEKRNLVNNMSHRGFIQCVDFLLVAGADMYSVLCEAVAGQQVAMLQFLLSIGAHIDGYCCDPINFAVEFCSIEIISMLLEAGAGVNLQDRIGDTPLILATQRNSIGIIALLLEKSADPNLIDFCGASPLQYAKSAGAASLLLQHGAAVNYVNSSDDNKTPLHNASQQGHIDVVSSLLAWGADVNAKTCGNETPLHLAKNTGIAELLLEASCDVNAQDERDNTTCHVGHFRRGKAKHRYSNGLPMSYLDALKGRHSNGL